MAGPVFSHWIYLGGGRRIAVWRRKAKRRSLRELERLLSSPVARADDRGECFMVSNPVSAAERAFQRLFMESHSTAEGAARDSAATLEVDMEGL